MKLLRLLQEGRYYPIGSDLQKASDARVLVATNRDLAAMQEKGTFRRDLYYRLRSHHVHLPPLRRRREDLPLLVDHFLGKAASLLGRGRPTPPKELVGLLGAYAFPGNVRELEGMIYDAVSRHRAGVLSLESFREKIGPEAAAAFGEGGGGIEPDGDPVADATDGTTERGAIVFGDTLPTLPDIERLLIEEALRRSDGNQTTAAHLLGLSRRALNNRLRRAAEDCEE